MNTLNAYISKDGNKMSYNGYKAYMPRLKFTTLTKDMSNT